MKNILFFLSLALLSGCGQGKRPNVLILTLDTTRADHLGCYGYDMGHTPNLDTLAAEGALFEEAQSVMPITTPTHATIFTGRLPLEHGIRLNREGVLPVEIPTMAEIFKANGYETAAVVATRILDAKFGLNRGFDLYDGERVDGEDADAGHSKLGGYRLAQEISDASIKWLKDKIAANKRAPFLLWAHYYDPHIPRRRHRELAGLKSDNLYDNEIAYMDHHIGRLLKELESQGLVDDTLVIALADHGESLGDHNEMFHGFFIYQSTQHIPMLFRWPGKIPAGLKIPGTVSQTDLMATVMELAGVDPDKFIAAGSDQGQVLHAMMEKSFAAAVCGDEPLTPRVCHMEALWTNYYFDWAPLAGIVDDQWSYIRAPESELYDLKNDYGQTNSLAEVKPRLLDEMALRLEQIESGIKQHKPEDVDLTEAEMRSFASLGYVSGRNSEAHSLTNVTELAQMDNPKTKSPLVLAHNRQYMLNGAQDVSDELLDDSLLLVEEFPKKIRYLVNAAKAYEIRNQPDEALALFERARVVSPENTVVLTHLGMLYDRKGDLEKTRECFAKAAELRPQDIHLQNNYNAALWRAASVAREKGDLKSAELYLKKLQARDPENISVRQNLQQIRETKD